MLAYNTHYLHVLIKIMASCISCLKYHQSSEYYKKKPYPKKPQEKVQNTSQSWLVNGIKTLLIKDKL